MLTSCSQDSLCSGHRRSEPARPFPWDTDSAKPRTAAVIPQSYIRLRRVALMLSGPVAERSYQLVLLTACLISWGSSGRRLRLSQRCFSRLPARYCRPSARYCEPSARYRRPPAPGFLRAGHPSVSWQKLCKALAGNPGQSEMREASGSPWACAGISRAILCWGARFCKSSSTSWLPPWRCWITVSSELGGFLMVECLLYAMRPTCGRASSN
jgi:hypothetical protein